MIIYGFTSQDHKMATEIEAFVPIYSLLVIAYLFLIVIAEATDGYIFIGCF